MTELHIQRYPERECGTCTECCEGWLSTTVNGYEIYPGRPCQFVGEGGCSIHENKPEDPCRIFKCEWLENNDIAGWMKPNKSKVIIMSRDWSYEEEPQGEYLVVIEAGQQIDSEIFDWLVNFHLNKNIPMIIQVSKEASPWSQSQKEYKFYGNEKFLKFVDTINFSEQ